MDSIRFFDFLFAFLALIVLSPLMILLAIIIKLSSKGPVLYEQVRVGKDGIDFKLFKFRSMYLDADKRGLLTVGGKDNRITTIGYYLRKFKLDEIPQIINVLRGEMSIVGPRPEVRKYVNYYTAEQLKVLTVLPGITDNASIFFRNENELLANADDPEAYYIYTIIPQKISLNQHFIQNRTLGLYFQIIWKTAITSLRGK